MQTNEIVRKQIFEVIDNQMKSNTPPETNLTYRRLRGLGYTDFVTKQYIGQCVAFELFTIMKENKPFDEIRYIKHLKQLPEEPGS